MSYFISYSTEDGRDFARRLRDILRAGDPPLEVWQDGDGLRAGQDWPAALARAIADCDAVIYVMTRDSVSHDSFCMKELLHALDRGKRIIPVRLDPEVGLPLIIKTGQYLEFTCGLDAGAASESALSRLRMELLSPRPATGAPAKRCRVINQPPFVPPAHFKDRYVETKIIGEFLKDEARRLLTVSGRGGTGKTAMVCRLLRSLEWGRLPNELGPLEVDGIVYLNAHNLHRINASNILADLCKLLPEEEATRLAALNENPQLSAEVKMRELLSHFTSGRYVLLLDSFDTLLDQQTFELCDAELNEALRALLEAVQHTVKVIVTTRARPRSLGGAACAPQQHLALDEGLEAEYARATLREMDADGAAGLRDAPDSLLDEAWRLTLGFPRALEALYAILSDGFDPPRKILNEIKSVAQNNVVRALVGEAFNRLDQDAQRVMQALAVYRYPVTLEAVEHLLAPFGPVEGCEPALRRLVGLYLVRPEADCYAPDRVANRYSLHQLDSAYALSHIPPGGPADREADPPPFTRFALLHRAAEYLKAARKPAPEWKDIADMAGPQAEFELRYAGQDYDAAASVLYDVSPFFYMMGQYSQLIEVHERLVGAAEKAGRKFADARLGCIIVANLGTLYRVTGRIPKAVERYERALALAREAGDRGLEGRWEGFLGICHALLGETSDAIEHIEEALGLVREVKDREAEASFLGDLGNLYTMLGDATRATECYEQALDLAREVGDFKGQSRHLCNLADLLTEKGRYREAIRAADESERIAEQIKSTRNASFARGSKALAYFFAGDMASARREAEAARLHDEPSLSHHISGMLGIIMLKQGDRAGAAAAFGAAAAQADGMIEHSARNYRALDSKGLALSGLALCGDASRASEAREAYRRARAINADAGVVLHALMLFEALALADTTGILDCVREVLVRKLPPPDNAPRPTPGASAPLS